MHPADGARMGDPQITEPVSWGVPTVNRVLLLAVEADGPRIDLMLPQLELQGLDVGVEWISSGVRLCLDRPMVVAVVVSPALDRGAARPYIEAVAHALGPGQRLLVLDMRNHPSVVRLYRAITRTLEGLQRTVEIESQSGGGLTASASRRGVASGSVTSSGSTSADTLPLRVVHPPVLLAWPLHEHAEVVPSTVRHDVRNRARSRPVATAPDLEPIDPHPWLSAG